MSTDCTVESGTCGKCTAACRRKPGWFLPGEVEKVAEFLGVTAQELFDTKLGVDWWDDYPAPDVFVLAPATTAMDPGEEYPGDPRGVCVFFENERCTIHAVKPYECRQYVCTEDHDAAQGRHESVSVAWREHQEQIVELLGRKPESESWGMGGFLANLFGGEDGWYGEAGEW